MFCGAFPLPSFFFFLRERRVLIRFPNVDPFSKRIQRFMPFLKWFFPPWWSKLKSHSSPQSQPAAWAWARLTLQRPKPQREETLSLQARSHWHWPHGGMRRWKDCLPTPHPKSSTQLWPKKQETDREKVRGGVEGREKKSLRREGLVG